METTSPTALGVQLYGLSEGYSRSRGAREVRRIARELFPADAPGKGGRWRFDPDHAAAIKAHLSRV
jgi:hypothetical protein